MAKKKNDTNSSEKFLVKEGDVVDPQNFVPLEAPKQMFKNNLKFMQ